jgi:hypothetical protein
LLLETAAAGGELCPWPGAAAAGCEGATGIEGTSLGGTVDEFAASLAAGTADSGGDSAAGALADDGVAADSAWGATAR